MTMDFNRARWLLVCALLFFSAFAFAWIDGHGETLGGYIICMFAFILTAPIAFFCTLICLLRFGARQWKWAGISPSIYAIPFIAAMIMGYLRNRAYFN